MFSIYIHIPFCLQKCSYCDFHSVAMGPEDVPGDAYVKAVIAEAEILAEKYGLRGKEVGSIYFGGGTPTLLETRNVEQVLVSLRKIFEVSPDAEITIEANPETLVNRPTHLFNRLSIGIQSFNDAYLQKLGRIHSAQTARKAVKLAQDAGFKNINIDLMWGLPGQTLAELEEDLDEAIKLNVQHISAYQLTLGHKTSNDDLSIQMFYLINNKLSSANFDHYEISNFAKVRCLHNLNYWHYGEWLGLGSGATSFLGCHPRLRGNDRRLIRFTSSKDISQYLRQNFSYETETISQKTAMAEYCFLALRTSNGINLGGFKQRFGKEFDEVYPNLRQKWSSLGLTYASTHPCTYALNEEGWLISDELFQELV